MTTREVIGAMTRPERFFFWFAIINFGIFVAIAVPLGGDALNGTFRDGHYYLMQHGVYTEVSKAVFIYSFVHTLSVFITVPIATVMMFIARSRARETDD